MKTRNVDVGLSCLIIGVAIGILYSRNSMTHMSKEDASVSAKEAQTLILAREYTIPLVSIDNATLEETIDFLRRQTRTVVGTASSPPRIN